MNNQSPTPRTDAVMLHRDVYKRNGNESEMAWSHASTLERELAEANRKLEVAKEALDVAEYALSHPQSNQRFALDATRSALTTINSTTKG